MTAPHRPPLDRPPWIACLLWAVVLVAGLPAYGATDPSSSHRSETAPALIIAPRQTLLSVSSRASRNEIYLVFAQAVGNSSALSLTNYAVSGVNLSAVRLANSTTVVLTAATNLPLFRTYQVTVRNVTDTANPPLVLHPNPSVQSFDHPASGAFFSDFNSGAANTNLNLYGPATRIPSGGIGNSGALELTKNISSQNAAVLIQDFNQGQPVERFTATFQLRIGEGTCCGERTADGFSFNFAPDLPEGPYFQGEDGAGSGIRVTFDTWDNYTDDEMGNDTAPAISLIVNHQQIAVQSMAGIRESDRPPATPFINDPATGQPMKIMTGTAFAPVEIHLDPDGTVDVSYKGVPIFVNVSTPYFPVPGRFGMGARTGAADDNHVIDNLVIKTFGNLGPVVLQTQPEDQLVPENSLLEFRVSADGSPVVRYQWLSDGTEIPEATSALLVLPASLDRNGTTISARVYNDFSSVTTRPARIAVIADHIAPTLTSILPAQSLHQVVLLFSEPVDVESAVDPGHYSLADEEGTSLAIEQVFWVNDQVVVLETAPQANGTLYVLQVHDVRDRAAASNVIAPGSSARFQTPPLRLGQLSRQYYGAVPFTPRSSETLPEPDGGLGGNELLFLTGDPTFPDQPRFADFAGSWELNTFDQAEDYGARLSGFFIPRTTGNHVFYLASDDNSELWLSTDADPSHEVLIAYEPEWNGRREWVTSVRRPNQENISPPIFLVAGQRYYMESLLKEGVGGDHMAVAVQEPNQAVPANGSSPITSELLATSEVALPLAPAPVIIEQPNGAMVTLGGGVNLCVTGSSSLPLFYQWRLNGIDLPGETNSCLTRSNVQVADGGNYSVVIANQSGAVSSQPALVGVTLDKTAPGDNFAQRVSITGASGLTASTNVLATLEPGEPLHAGKVGGHSVWYTWTPAATGIATVRAAGSSFDTLLAVYTGTNLNNLTLVAADDDGGGFFTSQIRFNVVGGQTYQFALDGFGGASGSFVVSWETEIGVQTVARIVTQPQSQTVDRGATAVFTVGATGTGLSYRWLFNGTNVQDGPAPSLLVANVQEASLGTYVVIVNSSGHTIESVPAILQINRTGAEVQTVHSEDKFLNANLNPLRLGDPGPGLAALQAGGTGAGAVVRGYSGTQIFSSVGAHSEAGEPNHCGVIGGASQWLTYLSEHTGMLFLNTDGSTFDTVVAVYTGDGLSFASLIPVACDNNSGLDQHDSSLAFPVQPGVTYYIAIDGVAGAKGTVHLSFALVIPGRIEAPRQNGNGAFLFRLLGQPAMKFNLEISSDLKQWIPFLPGTSASGIFEFMEPSGFPPGQRFYRATMIP